MDNNDSTENISQELLEILRYGYTEISPSGKGYHIWVKGKMPTGMGRIGYTADGEKLEVFGGSGWVTVTGDIDWAVSSLGSIRKEQTLINNLYKSYFKQNQVIEKKMILASTYKENIDLERIKIEMFNGPKAWKIQRLWNGDTSMHKGDHSSADLALCRYLVQHTEGDYQLVDALFRQSKLYRKKWDEKRGKTTYGGLTINKALENVEFYINDSQTFTNLVKNDVFYEDDDFTKSTSEKNSKITRLNAEETEFDMSSNIEEEITLILEKINAQAESNRSIVKKLNSFQNVKIKGLINGLETQNAQSEFINETQKQLKQLLDYMVYHNSRCSDQHRLLFGRVIEITERQERLEDFNQRVLRRLEEQQEYFNRTIEKNNIQLITVLKELLEAKIDYKEISTNEQQNMKVAKRGFFSRLFNR